MPVLAIRPRYVPPIVGRGSQATHVGAVTEPTPNEQPRAGLTWVAGSVAVGGVIGQFFFGSGVGGILVGGVAGVVSRKWAP